MVAAESQESEKPDAIPMTIWPTLMKSPPSNEGAKDQLMKATKEVILMETKAVVDYVESKSKICICSPTSHAGSFRCHLHRATVVANNTATPPKTGVGMEMGKGNKSNVNKLNSKSSQQPILSRFGRTSLKLKPISDPNLPG